MSKSYRPKCYGISSLYMVQGRTWAGTQETLRTLSTVLRSLALRRRYLPSWVPDESPPHHQEGCTRGLYISSSHHGTAISQRNTKGPPDHENHQSVQLMVRVQLLTICLTGTMTENTFSFHPQTLA